MGQRNGPTELRRDGFSKFLSIFLSVLQFFWTLPADIRGEESLAANPALSKSNIEGYVSIHQAKALQTHENYLVQKQAEIEALRTHYNPLRPRVLGASTSSDVFQSSSVAGPADPAGIFRFEDLKIQNLHNELQYKADVERSKIAARGEYYILFDNRDNSIKKITYFDALPRRIENERIVDAHGKTTVQNTVNMKYNNNRQLISYDRESIDGLGNKTKTTWKEATYYTGPEAKANPRAKEGNVKSYTEIVELATGEIITRHRRNILYYTEGDEKANSSHLKDQVAGYEETYITNQAPDAPREIVWSDATYFERPFTPTNENPIPVGSFTKKDDIQAAMEEPDILLTNFHEETTVLGLTSVRDVNNIEYNNYEEQTSYDETLVSLGILQINEFREGTYNEWGRLYSYKITSNAAGLITVTERLETLYTKEGLVSYYKELVTADGLTSTVEYLDAEYNDIGQVIAFTKITTNSEGQTILRRSGIEYNSFGLETQYTDVIEQGALTTIIEMTDITYTDNGLIFSFHQEKNEFGTVVENGEVIEIDRTTIIDRLFTHYNDLGQEIEFMEKIVDPLGITEILHRSGIERNSLGQIIAYNDFIIREKIGLVPVPLLDAEGKYIYGPDGQVQIQMKEEHFYVEINRSFEGSYNGEGQLVFSREIENSSATPELTLIRTRQAMEYTRGHLTNFIETLEEQGPGLYKKSQRRRTNTQLDDRGHLFSYDELFIDEFGNETLTRRLSTIYSDRHLPLSYDETQERRGIITAKKLLKARYDPFDREITSQIELIRGPLRELRTTSKEYNTFNLISRTLEQIQSNATALLKAIDQALMQYTPTGILMGFHKIETEEGNYIPFGGTEVQIDRTKFIDRVETQRNGLGQETLKRTIIKDALGFEEDTTESNIQYNTLGLETDKDVFTIKKKTGQVEVPQIGSDGFYLTDIDGNLITQVQDKAFELRIEKLIRDQLYNEAGQLIHSVETTKSNDTPDKTVTRIFADALYYANDQLAQYREIFHEEGSFIDPSYGTQVLDSTKEIFWQELQYNGFDQLTRSLQTIVDELGVLISKVREITLYNAIGLVEQSTESETRNNATTTRQRLQTHYDPFDREIFSQEILSQGTKLETRQTSTNYNNLNQVSETLLNITSNVTPLTQIIHRQGMVYGGLGGNFLTGFHETQKILGSYIGVDGVSVTINRTKILDRLDTQYNTLGQDTFIHEKRSEPSEAAPLGERIKEDFTRNVTLYNPKGQMIHREEDLRTYGETLIQIPILNLDGEETAALEQKLLILDKLEHRTWTNAQYNAIGQIESYVETSQLEGSDLIQTTTWSDAQYEENHVISYEEKVEEKGSYIDGNGQTHTIDRITLKTWEKGDYNDKGELMSYEQTFTDELGQITLKQWGNAQYGPTGLIQSYEETITLNTPTPQVTHRVWHQGVYDSLDRITGYVEEITDHFGITETRTRTQIQYNGVNFMSHYLDQIHREAHTVDSFGIPLDLVMDKTVEWFAREFTAQGQLLRYHETVKEAHLAQTVTRDYVALNFDSLSQLTQYTESIRTAGNAIDDNGNLISLNILQKRNVQIDAYNTLGQMTEGTEMNTEKGQGYELIKTIKKEDIIYEGTEPISFKETLNTNANLLTQVRTRNWTTLASLGHVIAFNETSHEFGTDSQGNTIDRTTQTTRLDTDLDPLGRLFGYVEEFTDAQGILHTTERSRMYYDIVGRLIAHHEERTRSDIPGDLYVRDFYGATFNAFGQLTSYIEEEQGFGVTAQKVRTGVQYDHDGNITDYIETVTDRGVITQNIFSNGKYNNDRQLTDYHLTTTSLGKTTDFDFHNAIYNPDGNLIFYEATLTEDPGITTQITFDNADYDDLSRLINFHEVRQYGNITEEITTIISSYDTENRPTSFSRSIQRTGPGLNWNLFQARSNITYDGLSDLVTGYHDNLIENGISKSVDYQVTLLGQLRRIRAFELSVTQSGVTQTLVRSSILYDFQGTFLKGAQIGYTDTFTDSRYPGLTTQITHQTLGLNNKGLETSFSEHTITSAPGLSFEENLLRTGILYNADGFAYSWTDTLTNSLNDTTVTEAFSNVITNDLGQIESLSLQRTTTNGPLSLVEDIDEQYSYDNDALLESLQRTSTSSLDPSHTIHYTLDQIACNAQGQITSYRETWDHDYPGVLNDWTETLEISGINRIGGKVTAYDADYTNTKDPSLDGLYEYTNIQYDSGGLVSSAHVLFNGLGPSLEYDEAFTYDSEGRITSRTKIDSTTSTLIESWTGILYNANGQISTFTYEDTTGPTTYSGIAYTGLSLEPDDTTLPHPELVWTPGSVPGDLSLQSQGDVSSEALAKEEAIAVFNSSFFTLNSSLPSVLPEVIPVGGSSVGTSIFKGTTTQVEKTGVSYNSNGQVTGYTEVTRIFGTIKNPDGTTQEIEIVTTVIRKATVYDIFGQEIGFKQLEIDPSGVQTSVIRSNITRNELGIVTGFTETRAIIFDPDNPEVAGLVTTTQVYQVNSYDQLGRTLAFTETVQTDGTFNNPLNNRQEEIHLIETINRTATELDELGRTIRTEETYTSSAEAGKITYIEKDFGEFDPSGFATEVRQNIRETGKDEYGNELDITREIEKTGILHNELGLEIAYREEVAVLVAGVTTPFQHLIRDYQVERVNKLGKVTDYSEYSQDLVRGSTQQLRKRGIEYTARGKEKSFFTEIKEKLFDGTEIEKLIAGQNYQYNLFNQLVSSKQILTEKFPGKPLKTTNIDFSSATYNQLGQLYSYNEQSIQNIGSLSSSTLRQVSKLRYSTLGLQSGSTEKIYEGGLFQFERQTFGQHYDLSGQLIGDQSTTRQSTGEVIQSQRSKIKHDKFGNITSFSENGYSNASGYYSFNRSQTLDILGQVTSIKENGTRSNGGPYSLQEGKIRYDDLGRKIAFHRTEKDSMGTHILDRAWTKFDNIGRTSAYKQKMQDHFVNSKQSTTQELRDLIRYDNLNRMTSWRSHTEGTNTEAKAFNQTTTTQVHEFDSAGRAIQLTESTLDHLKGKTTHSSFTQGFNDLGQLAWKEYEDERGDTVRQTYSYDARGVLSEQRIEHPDYIVTLDAFGKQLSMEEGPRIKKMIREAEEAAASAYAKAQEIEKELLRQAQASQLPVPNASSTSLRGAQGRSNLNQPGTRNLQLETNLAQTAQQAQAQIDAAKQQIAKAESQIRSAKTQAEKAKAEAEKKVAEAKLKVAEAQKKLLEAKTKEAKDAAIKARALALQELQSAKQNLSLRLPAVALAKVGDIQALSEEKLKDGSIQRTYTNGAKITYKGNRAWVEDAFGNKLAEATVKGNKVEVSNLFTGNQVTMTYGRFGIENVTEVNSLGKEVRTETYTYKTEGNRLREVSYTIRDEQPTLIETSQGYKPVIASGTKQSLYEASGTTRFDAKGRVEFAEEHKTLKTSKGGTIYQFHSKFENVQYDRLNQLVSFRKEISERGLGIKKYSTTVTRIGEVDATGRLSHYIENERTKQGKVKISRTFEARPTYEGDKLISENRIMTAEKVKKSGGFFSKIMGGLMSFGIGLLIGGPVVALLNVGLNTMAATMPESVLGKVAGIASGVMNAVMGNVFGGPLGSIMSSTVNGMAQGLMGGQDMGQIMQGALIGTGIGIVTVGANWLGQGIFGGGVQNFGQTLITPSFTKASVEVMGRTFNSLVAESVTKQMITRSIMTFAGDKLGTLGSSILGGVLGSLTGGNPGNSIITNVILGTAKGTASGFINQGLGNDTWAQFAGAALGGLSDAAIDSAAQSFVAGIRKNQEGLNGLLDKKENGLIYDKNSDFIIQKENGQVTAMITPEGGFIYLDKDGLTQIIAPGEGYSNLTDLSYTTDINGFEPYSGLNQRVSDFGMSDWIWTPISPEVSYAIKNLSMTVTESSIKINFPQMPSLEGMDRYIPSVYFVPPGIITQTQATQFNLQSTIASQILNVAQGIDQGTRTISERLSTFGQPQELTPETMQQDIYKAAYEMFILQSGNPNLEKAADGVVKRVFREGSLEGLTLQDAQYILDHAGIMEDIKLTLGGPSGPSGTAGPIGGMGGPSSGTLGLYASLPSSMRQAFVESFQTSPAFMKALYENPVMREKFMKNFYMMDAYPGEDGGGKYDWYLGNFFSQDPTKQDITMGHGFNSPKGESMSVYGMPFQVYLALKASGIDGNMTGLLWDGKKAPFFTAAEESADRTALAHANYETAGYFAKMAQKVLLFAPPVGEARNMIGHSLFARETLGAVDILRQRGIPVGAVLLMDPAVDNTVFQIPKTVQMGARGTYYTRDIPEGEFTKAAQWAEKIKVYHSKDDKVLSNLYRLSQWNEYNPLAIITPAVNFISHERADFIYEPALGLVGPIGGIKDYPSNVIPVNLTKGESEIPGVWVEEHSDYFRKPYEEMKLFWQDAAKALEDSRRYHFYGNRND